MQWGWLLGSSPRQMDITLLILRVALAVVMWPHGAQKVFGWFNGSGFGNTLNSFDRFLGIPPAITVLVILVEFLAPFMLTAGLLTRLAALALAVEQLVAGLLVNSRFGWFMDWDQPRRSQGGEGIEWHVLTVALGVGLVLCGAGAWSLDAWLARRLAARGAPSAPLRTPAADLPAR